MLIMYGATIPHLPGIAVGAVLSALSVSDLNPAILTTETVLAEQTNYS